SAIVPKLDLTSQLDAAVQFSWCPTQRLLYARAILSARDQSARIDPYWCNLDRTPLHGPPHRRPQSPDRRTPRDEPPPARTDRRPNRKRASEIRIDGRVPKSHPRGT